MQEEVTQRTIALVIKTAKLDAKPCGGAGSMAGETEGYQSIYAELV